MIDWSTCPGVESVPGKHSGDWVFTGSRLPVYASSRTWRAGPPWRSSWTGLIWRTSRR